MLVVAVSDVASTHNRDLHRFEIAWSNPAMLRERRFTCRNGRTTSDCERGPRDQSTQRQRTRRANTFYSRQCNNAWRQLVVESLHRRAICVTRRGQRQTHGQNTISIEARIDSAQLAETLE